MDETEYTAKMGKRCVKPAVFLTPCEIKHPRLSLYKHKHGHYFLKGTSGNDMDWDGIKLVFECELKHLVRGLKLPKEHFVNGIASHTALIISYCCN